MQTEPRKILLVEGIEDKKVIEKLLQRRKINYTGFAIKNQDGLQKLLKALPLALQVGSYETVGIIVDADLDLSLRWVELQNILNKIGYKNLPINPVSKGIVLIDEEEFLPKLGVWIMPDNQLNGKLEDFIEMLIPKNDDLKPIAITTVKNLITKNQNRFTKDSESKAFIHTWLAWQERPGTLLGNAITYRMLKTQEYIMDDGKASVFINWLQKLFKD